jgi:hypothetical protein
VRDGEIERLERQSTPAASKPVRNFGRLERASRPFDAMAEPPASLTTPMSWMSASSR